MPISFRTKYFLQNHFIYIRKLTIINIVMSYTLNGISYPAKILIAWGESITGNMKITEWLMKNGFTELGLFHYALRNETRSRDWLLNNGFAHLLALINGIERNEKALSWLKEHDFELLHEMALIGDGDDDAHQRLVEADLKIFALLARKMQAIKDEIEDRKYDYHKYSSDQGG